MRRISEHGTVASNQHPILDAAAARAAARWCGTVSDTPDLDDIDEILALLVSGVEQRLADPAAPIDARARSRLGRRLLELLRREVVEGWRETDPGASVAPGILAAIERVREAIEPPWADFASRLPHPEGLELAVVIAHDLRSPLTSILFLAEALQREQSGPVTELQRRQLGLIRCAALGLSALTNDVIDVVRGGGYLIENEAVPFSVSAVLHSVVDMVRPIAEEKHLALGFTPPTADQRLGHPVALSRVLLNLTTNALKFTEEGSVDVVARERSPAQLEFGVQDSGKGIDPAVVKTLYQPLRPAGGRTGPRFSQTGLGLSMCRTLVRLMGGELQVETRRGEGTRFFFELRLPIYGARLGEGRGAALPAGC